MIRGAVVPDPGFAKEIETRPLHDLGLRRYRIRAEKDCGAKDSLERGDQSAVLLPTIAHAECLQHLGSGFESDGLTLLLDGQGRQKDRNNPNLVRTEPHGSDDRRPGEQTCRSGARRGVRSSAMPEPAVRITRRGER